ncbi:MAG: 2Fe-2S iron-sulfur cluster-binding protein, partial [Acidimicrobiales bacterium]
MNSENGPALELMINGEAVSVPDDGRTLLDVLRTDVHAVSVKDGCSPQGQCGCCTVLVDGQPRVSCVTPARRVQGREITTLEGVDEDRRLAWAAALTATGGSQCGFCTPGIICRLVGAEEKGADLADAATVGRALQAHLCRCTGWQTISEAAVRVAGTDPVVSVDRAGGAARALLEGRCPQQVGPAVALGAGGFADDGAPTDALVAVPDGAGDWTVAESLVEARLAAGKVQGRRTTATVTPPLALPPGEWDRTLRTAWVEPAYLETDASWCEPGGEPASPLANGGAFGAKQSSEVAATARRLADLHGRPVRVLLSREDTVRLGPKRPPVAVGLNSDGTGVMRTVRTPGMAAAVGSVLPDVVVDETDIAGPSTSIDIRGAGWAEAVVVAAGVRGRLDEVTHPDGGRAQAELVDGVIRVGVACGEVLDEVVLRSYCIGAAHMAYSWVTSEGLAVADDGTIGDLTVRSFGIVRAIDTPPIEVTIT